MPSPGPPNPFNPATRIQYELAAATHVRLVVYNLLGQTVRTLVDRQQPAGRYSVIWDARSDAGYLAPSGPYVYRLESASFRRTHSMLLIR